MEGGELIMPESVERHFQSTRTIVEANSYHTRGEPLSLDINGNNGEWHSVKGGVFKQQSPETEDNSLSYEILFNPQEKKWLKIVPPQAAPTSNFELFEKRLRSSADYARTALEVSGLPHLADQIEDCTIKKNGEEVYGFVSPHIGPSIEHFIYKETGSRRTKNLPEDLAAFIEDAYQVASDQAEQLYIEHGIWMDDPNPGNILLHENGDKLHVVLIDFSNRDQHYDTSFSHIPKEKLGRDEYNQRVNRLLLKGVGKLHKRFQKQCEILQVNFQRSSEAIEENLKLSPALS